MESREEPRNRVLSFIRSHIGLNEIVIADHKRVILRRPVFHVLLLPVLMFHFMRQFEQTLG